MTSLTAVYRDDEHATVFHGRPSQVAVWSYLCDARGNNTYIQHEEIALNAIMNSAEGLEPTYTVGNGTLAS